MGSILFLVVLKPHSDHRRQILLLTFTDVDTGAQRG